MKCFATDAARRFALPLALCLAPIAVRGEEPEVDAERGVRWSSGPDGLELHAGGVFAGDLVLHETGEHPDDGAYVTLAKPILEGRHADGWRFRIAGDLIGTRTAGNLYEAFVAWEKLPWLRLSAGLMPLPLGLDAGYAPEDLPAFAHSFSYSLDHDSDWALRAEGRHGEGTFEWDVAYGVGGGFDANGQRSRGPRASARAFVRPLSGLFAGAGYLYSWDWDGELIVRDPLRTRLFDTLSFEADTSRFLTLTLGFEKGPVRIHWEKTVGGYLDAETPAGSVDLDDQTTSWQATASWMIRGGDYDSRIFSQRELAPPGPGAWELSLRYANADIDRDFYDVGLTDYSKSSQEFRTFTATLNWYATPNLRLSLGFMTLLADDDDEVLVLEENGSDTGGVFRAQYRF